MFGTRKTLAKPPAYNGTRGLPRSHSHNVTRSPDAAFGLLPGDDRVQVRCSFASEACSSKGMGSKSDVKLLQAALLAANKDREAAQLALAEAKVRQEETTEVSEPDAHDLRQLAQLQLKLCRSAITQELNWCMRELAQLQKEKNIWRCNSWLETASGRSTILAAPGIPVTHLLPPVSYSINRTIGAASLPTHSSFIRVLCPATEPAKKPWLAA